MAILNERLGLLVTSAPGAASTSIEAAFLALGGSALVAVPATDGGYVDPKHATVPELVGCGALSPSLVAGVRVVTSTRDPFAWWHAEWHRTRTRWAADVDDPSSWVHRVPGYVDQIARAVRCDFRPWLLDSLADDLAAGRQRHLFAEHVEAADVVLRAEHLAADLATAGLGGVRVEHRNRTSSDDGDAHRAAYDAVTRRAVAEVFAPDLARFGYRPP